MMNSRDHGIYSYSGIGTLNWKVSWGSISYRTSAIFSQWDCRRQSWVTALKADTFSVSMAIGKIFNRQPTQNQKLPIKSCNLCLVIECKVALAIAINLSLLMHSGDLRMVYNHFLLIIAWFLTPVRGIFLAHLGMISVIRVAWRKEE